MDKTKELNIEELKSIKNSLYEMQRKEIDNFSKSKSNLEKIADLQASIFDVESKINNLSSKKPNKILTIIDEVPRLAYLIILIIPVFIFIWHYVFHAQVLIPAYSDEDFYAVFLVKKWILLSGLFGAVSSLFGGLIAAFVSKNDDLKLLNSLGALLRFWGVSGAYYAIILTGIFLT